MAVAVAAAVVQPFALNVIVAVFFHVAYLVVFAPMVTLVPADEPLVDDEAVPHPLNVQLLFEHPFDANDTEQLPVSPPLYTVAVHDDEPVAPPPPLQLYDNVLVTSFFHVAYLDALAVNVTDVPADEPLVDDEAVPHPLNVHPLYVNPFDFNETEHPGNAPPLTAVSVHVDDVIEPDPPFA